MKLSSLHFFQENLMLSYELGEVKPGNLIFEKALAKFDLIQTECLFIDDVKINIQAAVKYGLPPIWHRTNAETFEKISKSLTHKL